jgi:Cu/Ag efflux protein CusF
LTDGLVIKIDQAAGRITIKHGPLKQFEMDEGMTMVYRADDPAMLKNIRVGDKIKFVADRANGQFTVTRIEKAR